MSATSLVCGRCINHGPSDRLGFDAYAGSPERGVFVLCDGANSCPDSGQAALWLSQALASDPRLEEERPGFECSLRHLHLEMIERFPMTAATVLAVQAGGYGLRLASVGDSRLVLLARRWGGWGSWRQIHEMPRDIDARGHPTQLVGSEVLDVIHQAQFPPRGRCLAVMMTDGLADCLTDQELLQTVSALGRHQPSSGDLDYLCQTLAALALDRGCQDDLSAVMVYSSFD